MAMDQVLLFGVELDDELFLDVFGDIFACGHMEEFAALGSFVPFNPGILAVVEACEAVGDNFERFAAFANTYDIAGVYFERGYVDYFAIDGDMLVEHDLTGGRTGGSYAQTVNHVVETRLEKLEQNLTGDTFETRSLLEEVAELTFEQTVGIFGLLLFAELNTVLRCFTALVLAVLARGEVATGENLVFAEDGFAEFAGYLGLGTCVSCHCLKSVCRLSGGGARGESLVPPSAQPRP